MRARSFLTGGLLCAAMLTLASCAQRDSATEFTPMPEEPLIRVLIIEGMTEVAVSPSAGAIVRGGETSSVAAPLMRFTREGDDVLLRSGEGGAEITRVPVFRIAPQSPDTSFFIEQVPVGVGWWWESTADRSYEGTIEVRPAEGEGLNVIVELPAEEYLRGVVPAEIGAAAPEEALKAQAVAARSETLTALTERTYAGPHYDICADVQCQVFAGVTNATPQTDAAIEATRGMVITYNGKPLPAYYSSNCGGMSENVESVWPSRDRGIPVWSAVFDGPGTYEKDLTQEANAAEWVHSIPQAYCSGTHYPDLPQWTHKNFRWERESTAAELSSYVAAHKDIGTVTDIVPLVRGESARLEKIRFVGTEGEFEIGPELAIRRLWESPLRSSAFVVEKTENDAGDVLFKITGGGYGHGVGMCQTGAMSRAMEGQTYDEILKAYYTDVELKKGW